MILGNSFRPSKIFGNEFNELGQVEKWRVVCPNDSICGILETKKNDDFRAVILIFLQKSFVGSVVFCLAWDGIYPAG